MSDIIPIKQAIALGYDVYWNDESAWFRFTENERTYVSGPFKTLEDAAYAALSDHDNIQAINREKEVWDHEARRDQD